MSSVETVLTGNREGARGGADRALDAPALQAWAGLVDATPTERSAALDRLAAQQPALHDRVARLLAAADRSGDSLRMGDAPWARAAPSPNAAEALVGGTLVGGYRLLEELGRGGMSVVWLAERTDGLIRQPVALKLPLFTLGSPTERQRFERERDVLSALHHPHIARLLDAGVMATGQPFIVVDFVDGQPLDEACNARRSGLPERLRWFMQVLDAVDHAHKHLVVHRDLKPSNVLLGRDGAVRLLDFGIAKLLDDSGGGVPRTALTEVAACPMTLRYAAPEQLENGTISTATDVYGLGVMLFELLCGVSPYGAVTSPLQWLRAVTEAPIARPSQAVSDTFVASSTASPSTARWRAALRGDLDNIVLKALRRDPSGRYGSVERLQDDLRRYLDQRPVAARPPSPGHRLKLFVRRHVGASLAAAVGSVAALGLAGVALQQYRQGEAERVRTEAVRDFMFDLVDDAEADERQAGAEPTGRQMVSAAVGRARDRFHDQPRLRGELLAELGRMQGRLGDDGASAALLRESMVLLASHAPAGDAPLNKTRAYLASVELEQGRPEQAAALAGTAVANCVQGPACAKARYYAHAVLGRVALSQGRGAAALAQMEAGVQACRAGFGSHHPETALAVLALAITARQAGELQRARAELDQALQMSQHLTLRLADRLAMARIRAVLSMDLGEHRDALARFQATLQQARGKADRAELLRHLANVQLALGDVGAAQEAAGAALAQGAPEGVEHLLARQARARASSLLGDPAGASDEMAQVIAGLRAAGFADRAMEVMRARRYQAEMQLLAGPPERGLALLAVLVQEQQTVMAGQELEFAQTLDLLGSTLQSAGRPDEAAAAHAQAALLFKARLPETHPYRLKNAALQQVAMQELNPAGGWEPIR